MTANVMLKPAFGRERPFEQPSHATVLTTPPDDASFPSGHAANAFAGAVTFAALLPDLQAIWWAVAALIAISRVYLGVHYPLDVAAGACVGAVSASIASRLIGKFKYPNA